MSIHKTEAVVLKIHPFRETSLILRLFTKDFGKIYGLIKGIRNQPQRYGGLPLVFSKSQVVFYEKTKQDLLLVSQFDTQEQFLPIRRDLAKTTYANYFVELLDTVTQGYDKNEALFQLIVNTLEACCNEQQIQQIARIFEIRLLNASGFKPRLDACVNCQRKIITDGKFSFVLGGILCRQCLDKDLKAKEISQGALASINYIEQARWPKALQLKMGPKTINQLAQILSSFLDFHLDKEIRSRKFLI
ncbi:MAG: DNA repair protein RecO [Candidatus Omnitrophica bacterium]|nr:DNA repair protein RecO [Candidatus Omnitrophota bacterium]